jgi:hypothetical protein
MGGAPHRVADQPPIDPAPLEAVRDLVVGDELAAVRGDNDRKIERPRRRRRDPAGRNAPIRMEHVEARQRGERRSQALALHQPSPPARHLTGSKIVHGRSQERIGAGRIFVIQGEDMKLVLAGQRFDEPQECRDDPLAARSVHAPCHHQADPHEGEA